MASIGATLALAVTGMGAPAQAKAPGQNGRIAFGRERPPAGDGSASYTISANGTHLRRLIAGKSDFPRWSPNGARISLGDMGCQFDGTCAAVIVDPDTGGTRVLRNPDPRRFSGVFCDTWSPDGARLACGAEGDAAGSSGVYTLRSSNGGGLQKVVGCDAFGPGGECGPVDYSPDGRRLLLMGPDRRGDTELFLVKSNGGGLHQVTPDGTLVDGNDSVASWSPRGNRILFGGYTDENHRRSIFMVNTDGTRLHQVPIPGCGSARSAGTAVACFNPAWSPNAARIVFSRTTVSPSGRIVSNIYTADPDGSHVVQVTHESNGLQVTAADWGPRRPASSG